MSAATAEPAATADSAEVSVALVGAGPRGTSVLERLCASAPELLTPGTRLTVHVVDPSPPGPGRVWRTDQPAELLMNTVASQVTLFTDDSVECAGPIRPGPSLHAWAAGELAPDAYPTRARYGQYLEWVFAEVVRGAPPSIRVEVHRARAIRLDDAADGHQSLVLDDGRTLSDLAAVILAQGHLPTVADQTQQRLTEYADRHGLRHIPPANPADLDLAPLAPGEPVLLRGLGLNFFDHMALLTTARGGRFLPTAQGGLRYAASGREPRLYAGSRRGIPYQARGDNAKGPYGRHTPLVLTPDVISLFRKRADSGDAADFLAEIWPLVAKEVETVYYETLLGRAQEPGRRADPAMRTGTVRQSFRERFLAVPHRAPQEALILDEFGIPDAERWSWDRISRPHAGQVFEGPGDFRSWLLAYLREDAEQAALGNVDGPLKAALDVLRDLRNEVRQIVDHSGLAGASRRDHLDRWYTPLNAFLSIGPPRRRIEEMVALIEAGVLEVLGPRLEVRAEDGAWVAHSPDVPGSIVRATTLIEARLPEPDLRRTADDLLARLLKTGRCRPHTVDGYETGGLDVTPRPYRLIDRQGHPHPRRFVLGVPTEGVHWVTAAGARPGVDSVTLSDTDAVARAALRTAVAATKPDTEADYWPDVELATID
ncbi:FAD/NAD(P)-binding protein [Streptomyces sporangiiformans]|uniref:FAD/NAD(P)-binding protein n=1 Tax=Streptomyces sporangiiformans TaxID=2315329 RepID=A0A505DFI0_9ACTN|nr:FAD/NAD(P)-binding protein [Streptomyces sporangiiformans]TPQ17866.1 FAD/NAD(P)-binding protein [Streptomyces sporangiiformans]